MFTVTYEITTYDSAENGDFAQCGFVTPGDWHWPIDSELLTSEVQMTLREAMKLASPDYDCGKWFSESGESRCDYATGAVEQRSIHPPQGITPASYQRLKRLFGVK